MPELKLYFSPRACSLACHIALEESGLPFTAEAVKIRQGQHKTEEYLRVNPWGKIPAMLINGEVLTEAHAILSYVADTASADKQLIPQDDPLLRARAHEWMNFLSGTVHIAFRPLFRPNYLIGDENLYPLLREVGVPIFPIIRFYKMRWGIEVEFRGLKQTVDKHKLRCRNSDRLLVELDWSIRAMAVAELLALREQIPAEPEDPSDDAYDPKDRSLANTMRALRTCMRNLNKFPKPRNGLLDQLSRALVQTYNHGTDKKARYRPKNPDKKPLGNPTVRKINSEERERLRKLNQNLAA